jgi:signal transduction histidine kinase/CheY-like chemotaxis protein
MLKSWLLKDITRTRVIGGVVGVIALVFIFEYSIMLVFNKLSLNANSLFIDVIDPFILIVLISPFSYFFILRPLFKSREELRKAKEAERRFLASMSHEIRTPLNAILGLIGFLSETELSKDQANYLESINLASDNLLAIVNDVLDFSKIEHGYLELNKNFFSVIELENEIKNTFQNIIESKNIKFNVTNSLDPNFRILADIHRLKQIIYNLLNNSIKFTQKGSISLSFASKKRNIQQMDFVLTITDTGLGMNREVTEKLFNDFIQGDSAIARKFGGTGLGLAISKKLVDLMKGQIQVASQEGVGSKFTVSIPVAYTEQIPSEPMNVVNLAQHLKSPELISKRKKYKILVAEDNYVNMEIVVKILELSGYRSVAVVNGRQVLEETTKRSFDIILMDCQMPELDGLEVTKILRKNGYNRPIIALTANVYEADRDKCFEAGMNDFISKPVTKEQLIYKLDNALGVA